MAFVEKMKICLLFSLVFDIIGALSLPFYSMQQSHKMTE
jgi:hypothetical protein